MNATCTTDTAVSAREHRDFFAAKGLTLFAAHAAVALDESAEDVVGAVDAAVAHFDDIRFDRLRYVVRDAFKTLLAHPVVIARMREMGRVT